MELLYAARYIKYRGFRKCAVWRRGYWRSFRTGISSFWSSDITSIRSSPVRMRRETLQICAAILKFTLYSCLVWPWLITVRLIRVSVMLYAISFAHISCLMYSGLYAWKLLNPIVYFSLRKEPSMAHLEKNTGVLSVSAEILPGAGWSQCIHKSHRRWGILQYGRKCRKYLGSRMPHSRRRHLHPQNVCKNLLWQGLISYGCVQG